MLGLCLAIVFPIVCYLIAKEYSYSAVTIPKRFYYDSVATKVVDGKTTTDTIWSTIPDVPLTNQLGDTVVLSDLHDKIIVANFFFVRCPTICPKLTLSMRTLQDALKIKSETRRIDTTFVHFVSYTVDPARDSVTALKNYADKFGVNHDLWWMLTGPKKEIYDLILDNYKLAVVDGDNVDSNFVHTEKFVLLDKDRVVRGYYDGLDSAQMSKLAEDITIIKLEKDKRKKRNLFRK